MKPSRINYSNSFPSNVNSACHTNSCFIISRQVISELLSLKSKIGPRKGKLTKKGKEQDAQCAEKDVVNI